MNRSAKAVCPLGRRQAQIGALYQDEDHSTCRKFQNGRELSKHQANQEMDHDSFQCIRAVGFRSIDWIDHAKTKTGYEIPFNRHFYVFTPPRPLEEIDAEPKQVTDRILEMIGGLSA